MNLNILFQERILIAENTRLRDKGRFSSTHVFFRYLKSSSIECYKHKQLFLLIFDLMMIVFILNGVLVLIYVYQYVTFLYFFCRKIYSDYFSSKLCLVATVIIFITKSPGPWKNLVTKEKYSHSYLLTSYITKFILLNSIQYGLWLYFKLHVRLSF